MAGKRKREAAEAVEPVDPIDQPTADAWLKNYNYMQSDNGFPASVKMTVKLVELLGASYRIIQPTDAGATPYVEFTLGHFALVCPIIGGVFEKIAGLKSKRRCGLAGGIFQEFKNEVAIADKFFSQAQRGREGPPPGRWAPAGAGLPGR